MISKIIFIFIFFLLVLPFVHSEIYISKEPLEKFNVGDLVDFSFEIKSLNIDKGVVEANLYCNGKFKRNIYLESGVVILSNFSKRFDISFFAKEEDECFVEISFSNFKVIRTKRFQVFSNLDTSISFNSQVFLPGESLRINGSVNKKNRQDFKYEVLLKIGDFLEKRYAFEENNFFIEYNFSEVQTSGEYNLEIYFEEKDFEENLINSDFFSEKIRIRPKPTKIVLLSESILKPGKEYRGVVKLLDQSDNLIENETVYVRISDRDGRFVESSTQTVVSGGNFSFYFEPNSSLGIWKIHLLWGDILEIKDLEILENKRINISFLERNNGVVIKNIGNVYYGDTLMINLTNETSVINLPIPLNLSQGEENVYFFKDLNSTYNISISSGNFQELKFSNLLITGNVISGNSLRDFSNIFYFIFIFIFISFIIFFFKFRERRISESLKKDKRLFKSKNLIRNPPVQKKKKGVIEKRIYGLFFNEVISEKLNLILKKYGFVIHKFGKTSFVIFKSSKSPESKLVNLAKLIYKNSENKMLLIHSVGFEKDPKLIKSFMKIKIVFNLDTEGVFITDGIYTFLKNKELFKKFSSFNKVNIWKLRTDNVNP